jgi:hypothetical protein
VSDPIARAIWRFDTDSSDAFDRRDDALAVLGQRLEPVEPYAVEEPETSWPMRETRTI